MDRCLNAISLHCGGDAANTPQINCIVWRWLTPTEATIRGYFLNRHLRQVAVKHAASECHVIVFIRHLNQRDLIPMPANKESFCM